MSHEFQLVFQLPASCPFTSLDIEDDITDADARVRENAAWALGEIGSLLSQPALQAVRSGDASVTVRTVANTAIKRLR